MPSTDRDPVIGLSNWAHEDCATVYAEIKTRAATVDLAGEKREATDDASLVTNARIRL